MTKATRKKESYLRIVWTQYRRDKLGVVGLLLVLIIGGVAIFAPFLAGDIPIFMVKAGKTYWLPNIITYSDLQEENFYANADRWQPAHDERAILPPIPYGPLRQDLLRRLEAPSATHFLGTDDRGRDVLSRLIWGARVSMSVGFVAVGLAVLIGVTLGALAGFYGGKTDAAVLRLIEATLIVPSFFLILAVMAFAKPSITLIMLVLGITSWPADARLVRGEFLKQKQQDYVTAARAVGLGDFRIIFRHILPNAISPVFVSAAFGIAGAIVTESALSFLGFGVPPPTASWGELLKQAQANWNTAWWLVTFPGVAIFVTVIAFNLVGQTLRDAMDPRLRQ